VRKSSRRSAILATVGWLAVGIGAEMAPAIAAEDALRVGMVPDAGATQVSIEEKAPLRDYLAKALGRPVALIIPTNYNATVEALGNGSLDFAYLGGLTYVKAHERYGVVPLVQRDSDREFHSLFITAANSPVRTLRDLKGKRFAFGDINSTSGHLMPYAALAESGIDAETDLNYRYTGSHPATAKAVEAGIVDAGAIDESVYKAMLADHKLDAAKLRIFYTTPAFVDYVWVARKDVGQKERDAFTAAFLQLDKAQNGNILAILRGDKFVRATDAEYGDLRKIAQELKLF